jgi:outer membrane translocation and assembly module TamA
LSLLACGGKSNFMNHHTRILILIAAAFGFLCPDSSAEKVVVTEIEAHNLTKKIDAKLGPEIIKKLRKSPIKYTSYRYLNRHTFLVSESKFIEQIHEKAKLTEGYVLQMRSYHEDDKLKLDFTVKKGDKTTLGPIKIKPGSSPTLVGPCKLQRGELILMIMLAK